MYSMSALKEVVDMLIIGNVYYWMVDMMNIHIKKIITKALDINDIIIFLMGMLTR